MHLNFQWDNRLMCCLALILLRILLLTQLLIQNQAPAFRLHCKQNVCNWKVQETYSILYQLQVSIQWLKLFQVSLSDQCSCNSQSFQCKCSNQCQMDILTLLWAFQHQSNYQRCIRMDILLKKFQKIPLQSWLYQTFKVCKHLRPNFENPNLDC